MATNSYSCLVVNSEMSLSPWALVLRCRLESHPDIALPPLQSVVIGSHTCPSFKRLPIRQMQLTTDAEAVTARLKQLSDQSASLNGRKLAKHDVVTVKPGDRLELLEGRYRHEVKRVRAFSTQSKEERVAESSEKSKTSCETISKLESSNNNEISKSSGKGHWAMGLWQTLQDPKLKVAENDTVVAIRDKYPKARHHFLVAPRQYIATVNDLEARHLSLVEDMLEMARKLTKKFGNQSNFRMGFHAVPSMRHVHLHVISDDFDSPCLKTKKHWNSFNTSFFVTCEKVLNQLRNHGKVIIDDILGAENKKELLNRPLKCNKCDHMPKTMPALKLHLRSHLKSDR